MKTYQSIKADPRSGLFGKTIWLMALVAMFLVSPLASATVWDLTAGKTNVVGTLTVTNDPSNVYVTYELTDPTAKFGTLHLWVGTDLSGLPTNKKGILVPGQFPNTADVTGSTVHTFTIPWTAFNGVCGTELFVVAHAEVNYFDGEVSTGGDTAFGGDTAGSGPRWWFYGKHTLTCPPPGEEDEAHSQWCSPGYWRNNTDSWPVSVPTATTYSFVFSSAPNVTNTNPANCKTLAADPTLLDVLENNNCYGGETFNSVADYLSTKHPDVNFTGERYFDVNGDEKIDDGEHDCPLD